jgi:hypothetical protein
MIGPFAAFALRLVRGQSGAARVRALQLIWFAGLPVVLVFVASQILDRSAFVPRYLIVAAPGWWLLVGLAVSRAAGPARTAATVATVAFCAFTVASGALREARGGEKIAWDRITSAIATDAIGANGTVYAFEGFTALPLAYYANVLETGLIVRPVGADALGTLEALGTAGATAGATAWAVIRSSRTGDGSAIRAALAARGLRLTPVADDGIPSQTITAYRIERQ